MRRLVLAGNWKMYKTGNEAVHFVHSFLGRLQQEAPRIDLILFPTFTSLTQARTVLENESRVTLGAQDCYFKDEGAYTGEVSVPMLEEVGVSYLLIGHSERRGHFSESDELIRRKLERAVNSGLIPLLCVGEPINVREAGQAEPFVIDQLTKDLDGILIPDGERFLIAYEPVWAIGTGKNAEPSDAESMSALIRGFLARRYGEDLAAATRILYGGSVNPKNIGPYVEQADVDGCLVGGASTDPDSFYEMYRIVNLTKA